MPRSTTIWAAALLLISMSGSGPMLTTAQAMPAPGPQQTGLKPRYYFPRHVKRQIVTNSTAPASSTSSSSSSSSTPDVETRHSSNFLSFLESFGNPPSLSSSLSSSSSSSSSLSISSTPDATTSPADPPSTITVITDVTVSPIPASKLPVGTGNTSPEPSTTTYTPQPPIPIRSSAPPSNVKPPANSIVGSSAGLPPPSSIVRPTASPEPSSRLSDAVSSLSSSPRDIAPTGLLPSTTLQPTSAGQSILGDSSSAVVPEPSSGSFRPSAGFPSLVVPTSNLPLPTDLPQPTTDLPLFASTGVLPPAGLQPTTSAAESIQSSSVLSPTSSAVPVVEPSATAGTGGLLPSTSESGLPILPTGTGGLLPSPSESLLVLPTSDILPLPTSDVSLPSLPTSGIIVGITTAFSASDAPTPSASLPIPTSESVPESGIPLISSFASELPLSSGIPSAPGPTAPTSTDPAITPIPILPSSVLSELSSLVSVITSDVNSIVSSIIPTSIPDLSSVVSSILPPAVTDISSIVIPTGTGVVPSLTDIPTLSSGIPASETISVALPSTVSGIEPSSGTVSGTGVTIVPTGSVTSVPSSIDSVPPTSDIPATTSAPTLSGTATPSANATDVTPSASEAPLTLPSASLSTSDSLTLVFTPPTITPTSIPVTGTNSETILPIGSSIIQEPSTAAAPSATASGIPSELPGMIAPPDGVPVKPANGFLGQIGFKWPLNYPFVCANDGGNQIFQFLPSQVVMNGIKPFDTTTSLGFITTLAIFWIPEDLQVSLQAQIRNPPDPFWHNKNQTINAGQTLGEGSTLTSGPEASATGRPQDGGALGGDMGASRKVNPTSVCVALGAIGAAAAYGAAMFFVARRYRNKKMSHKRSSSVPSTSRYTYGSMTGNGVFMSGGRGLGRTTPGGRDSRGSHGTSSSNGRSVRTQQISAPVMAENSLGWN
ncbi:hypothetical protein BCR34DRAFT_625694 [Clohesyomyces aquaticus]|uniref:Uncharacterized protein n=1 Tax=Clohesyomyces aquaticus TaxID=1231657 RepID=A0A1Y1ZGX4_9PLEO|nr:hypothetical protein BCR34DRAFT_625694 [Clohesyomyces aquaticus]